MSAHQQFAEGAILRGDCIGAMQTLPDGCVDTVFADPPYNLQLAAGDLRRPDSSRVDGVDASWDAVGDFSAYDRFTRAWLAEARRLLKPDGTIWITGTYHNIFRVGCAVQDLGFWMLNDVVWRKSNPMPNFRGRRFTNAHETLIWAARGRESRYRFDYAAMKALNDGVQMRSDWLLPVCAGGERLKKDGAKLHPTQKPEALVYRAVLASTAPGGTILDPFFGTGTTGAVAKRLGRRFIGIERDEGYVRAAIARIRSVVPDDPACLPPPAARSLPKIPFGALVETGLLRAGARLTDESGAVVAKVRADGNLILLGRTDGFAGSIHVAASTSTGRPGVNGWLYWGTKARGRFTPIDALRARMRLPAAV